MDLQEVLNNAMIAARAETMKTSPQLTVGEMLLKLQGVGNKALPVIFDEGGYRPTYIDSWRGSYRELALNYTQEGEQLCVHDMIALLKRSIGATFTGYKGGDYLMGKTTPVWVANYGNSEGFRDGDTAIIDVCEDSEAVIIVTAALEYEVAM